MTVLVVANPKGGVGKSTLATQTAGYWARQGHAVALGDLDPQQSSRLWLSLRPAAAPAIAHWAEVQNNWLLRPPQDATHVVLDTPAGLSGLRLKDALRLADKVLVPMQPSIFDIYATGAFLDELVQQQKSLGFDIGLVGMRVDERTLAAGQLRQFTANLGLPVLGMLRTTQNYVHLAAHGLSIYDMPLGRVRRDLEQWQGLSAWLDGKQRKRS